MIVINNATSIEANDSISNNADSGFRSEKALTTKSLIHIVG